MAVAFDLLKPGLNAQGTIDPLRALRQSQENLTPEVEAQNYWMPAGLATAVNVALHTGMPLLLTGDPGAGKTMAAFAVAHRFGMSDLLRFQVRSDSRAQDLRYRYEAAAHFRAVQTYRAESKDPPPDAWAYIQPGKLWLAIAPPDHGRPRPAEAGDGPAKAGDAAADPFLPRLLLVDEIDKAPRDFPNDLLNEFERLEFDIPEAPRGADRNPVRIAIEGRPRPIIVITSNAERRLPEPFLRRCIYHHIRLSDLGPDALAGAVRAHLGPALAATIGSATIEAAARMYSQFAADVSLRKRPSLPEIRAWLTALVRAGRLDEARAAMAASPVPPSRLPLAGALFKTRDDLPEGATS